MNKVRMWLLGSMLAVASLGAWAQDPPAWTAPAGVDMGDLSDALGLMVGEAIKGWLDLLTTNLQLVGWVLGIVIGVGLVFGLIMRKLGSLRVQG